jgi:hypothetical protein
VSKKYGNRSLARYPIFWCLDKIGSLPNPDPTDIAPWHKNAKLPSAKVDPTQEQQRPTFQRQAQEWAGLNVDPKVTYTLKQVEVDADFCRLSSLFLLAAGRIRRALI